MQYWLMKSEPSVYSIDDLKRDGHTYWDGVRNFQARNFIRDSMKRGDLVLFYHSNADPSGVAGIAKIRREGYPDFTSWDPEDDHFDPKAAKDNPLWYMVDVEYVEKFKRFIPLEALKIEALKGMLLTKRGSRLSVQPVSQPHFAPIQKMGREN